MKPVLKLLHSSDTDNLEKFTPVKNEPFACAIDAMFSPEGGEGFESFGIVVCNPEWIASRIRNSGPLIGRHYIIVSEFNFQELRDTILSFAEQCEGADWREVASKLSRLGHWEFEDYRS
jgi:hypothetical protein